MQPSPTHDNGYTSIFPINRILTDLASSTTPQKHMPFPCITRHLRVCISVCGSVCVVVYRIYVA